MFNARTETGKSINGFSLHTQARNQGCRRSDESPGSHGTFRGLRGSHRSVYSLNYDLLYQIKRRIGYIILVEEFCARRAIVRHINFKLNQKEL